MNNFENDFDFLKSNLNKLDKNITLPDSLKADKLLDLIEDIEPEPAPPKKGNKIISIFPNKRGLSIAAMLAVAIAFIALYKNSMNSNYATKSEEQAPPEAIQYDMTEADALEESYDESAIAEDRFLESEKSASPKEATPQISSAPNNFALQSENKSNWYIQENRVIQNEETVYVFPYDFTLLSSYNEGDLLIINGLQTGTDNSAIAIFTYTQNGRLLHDETIINKGETIYTLVYSTSTIIISNLNNNAFITSYVDSSPVQENDLEFTVDVNNIFESNGGFSITDGKSTAYIFDKSASLIRSIEIDESLTFENILVEGDIACLFLSNGETLNIPLY